MSGKRILVAPLDWGLGHATRCIPIIRYLIELGHVPVIASDKRPFDLLKDEFPDQEFYQMPGYNIEYPDGAGMAWKMFKSTPHILKMIKWEHDELPGLIMDLKLDGVISDNRFGLHTDQIPSVYMTHQVMIKAPMFEGLLHNMHMHYARKFSRCWVPDLPQAPGLSGDLGHRFPLPKNGQHIGPLSRFTSNETERTIDIVCVISGPEPQRTRFETIVLNQLELFEGDAVVVAGTPEVKTERTTENGHRIVPHLSADQLQDLMSKAKVVLSRSGYSTVMDLSVIGGKAIFVPTPGQTEQQYLADLFNAEGLHLKADQNKLNLPELLNQVEGLKGFKPMPCSMFKEAVKEFAESC